MSGKVAAFLLCLVMVAVAGIPSALADTHLITKGDRGPNESAVTWEYVPPDYGVWVGHIVNNGLRSVEVDVYDSTDGMQTIVSHQRIRFASYDAYPVGEVDTAATVMAAGRTYTITVTPNGPKGASCTVEDPTWTTFPVASFTTSVASDGFTVSVDGSSSTGDGLSYAWSWGDMWTSTGVTRTHVYVMTGDVTITLTVTDMYGRTSSSSQVVYVDWHGPVIEPLMVFGYMYASDGTTTLPNCAVIITVLSTGDTMTGLMSDPEYGYYQVALYGYWISQGDTLSVQATGPSGETGSNTGVVDFNMPYLQIDVTLS